MKEGVSNKITISRKEAEEAVRTLIKWIGDDPCREDLIDTPKRFINNLEKFFSGYNCADSNVLLSKTLDEVGGFSDLNGMVMLSNIDVKSYCEHHILPIIGEAYIAYIPNKKVVGISKIARLVQLYSRRLQIQERLTSQIANDINKNLLPKGVAVAIHAEHHCITKRSINGNNFRMWTSMMIGCFDSDINMRNTFWQKIGSKHL